MMESSSVWTLGVGLVGVALLVCLHCKRQVVMQMLVKWRVAAMIWHMSQTVRLVSSAQTWEQVFPRLYRYVNYHQYEEPHLLLRQ